MIILLLATIDCVFTIIIEDSLLKLSLFTIVTWNYIIPRIKRLTSAVNNPRKRYNPFPPAKNKEQKT